MRFLCIFFSFFYIYLMYIGLVTIWHTLYLSLDIYICWCMFFHLSLHVLSLFSLYAHASYILCAIFYFYFTLRCRDEFCLKCFKNIGCQSLLVINSLLAKFFKSLCYDRFYCIQQVSMSWVFITSLICLFICCGFVTDCQRGRLLGHMWIMLWTYVNIELANSLTKRTLLVIG